MGRRSSLLGLPCVLSGLATPQLSAHSSMGVCRRRVRRTGAPKASQHVAAADEAVHVRSTTSPPPLLLFSLLRRSGAPPVATGGEAPAAAPLLLLRFATAAAAEEERGEVARGAAAPPAPPPPPPDDHPPEPPRLSPLAAAASVAGFVGPEEKCPDDARAGGPVAVGFAAWPEGPAEAADPFRDASAAAAAAGEPAVVFGLLAAASAPACGPADRPCRAAGAELGRPGAAASAGLFVPTPVSPDTRAAAAAPALLAPTAAPAAREAEAPAPDPARPPVGDSARAAPAPRPAAAACCCCCLLSCACATAAARSTASFSALRCAAANAAPLLTGIGHATASRSARLFCASTLTGFAAAAAAGGLAGGRAPPKDCARGGAEDVGGGA